MRREALYLLDIVEAGERVATFLLDTDEAAFLSDSFKQSAAAFQLSLIGEAIGSLPDDLKQKYPDAEWHAARSLRNILAHRYFAINSRIIWEELWRTFPFCENTCLQFLKSSSLRSNYPDATPILDFVT